MTVLAGLKSHPGLPLDVAVCHASSAVAVRMVTPESTGRHGIWEICRVLHANLRLFRAIRLITLAEATGAPGGTAIDVDAPHNVHGRG
jgi:hypothetical protein